MVGFPLVFAFKSNGNNSLNETQTKYVYKRAIGKNSIGAYKSRFYEIPYDNNKSFNIETMSLLNNQSFSKLKMKTNPKKLKTLDS